MMKCLAALFLIFASWPMASPAFATEAEDYQSASSAYEQGQYTEAIQGFARVIRVNPNSWQAYQGMGSSELQLGDRLGALQAYQKSLALHPDNPSIKAMVDKLSGPSNPATPDAANPSTQTTQVLNLSPSKLSPILVNQGGPEKEIYSYQGAPLDGYEQFKNVTDLLHDPETDRLLEDSQKKNTAGLWSMIGGGALVAGGIIYYVAAKGTTQVSAVPGPFGSTSYFYTYTPADITPAFIMAGVGVLGGLIGGLLSSDSRQEKHDAVDRYNHLIGQGPNPTPPAGSPGGPGETHEPASK